MTTAEISLAPYEPIRAQIAELKAANASTVFKYEEPKGNKLARSHVASLRTVKGDIERKRKELKADALEYGRKVDAVAKELTGEIEAMIEVHDAPLREIEEREKARVAKLEARLAEVTWTPERAAMILSSVGAQAEIQHLERLLCQGVGEDWGEYRKRASDAANAALVLLRGRLHDLTRQESEAAELAKYREEQVKAEQMRARAVAEQERAKRDEAIRAAAEAKAKREAADAAMAEARKKEAEAQAAINAEKEKTRKAELAVAKAKQEKAEAEARVAREEQAKKDAEAKRAANAKHRVKILHEAAEAIAKVSAAGSPLDVAEAIASGTIPHVRMEF